MKRWLIEEKKVGERIDRRVGKEGRVSGEKRGGWVEVDE